MRDLERGWSQVEVARKYGVTCSSVSNWAMRFRIGGADALRARRIGRPPRLNGASGKIGLVHRYIVESFPEEFGLEPTPWHWRAIQALAFDECGLELSRWTISRYLKSWNIVPPRQLTELSTGSLRTIFLNPELASSRAPSRSKRGRTLAFVISQGSSRRLDDDGRRRRSKKVFALWSMNARRESTFAYYASPPTIGHCADFISRLIPNDEVNVLILTVDMPFNQEDVARALKKDNVVVRALPQHSRKFGFASQNG